MDVSVIIVNYNTKMRKRATSKCCYDGPILNQILINEIKQIGLYFASNFVMQVAYQLNANNIDREYKGLQEAVHTYKLQEGILLYYDAEASILPDNTAIKVIPVWEWLLAV